MVKAKGPTATVGNRIKKGSSSKPCGPVLDHRAYPHIFEAILQCPSAWIPLRGTSKDITARVESLMFNKVIVRKLPRNQKPLPKNRSTPKPGPAMVLTNHVGRLPVFIGGVQRNVKSQRAKVDRKRWGVTLNNYTKILDVESKLVEQLDSHYAACFQRIDVLRVRLTLKSAGSRPGGCVGDEDDLRKKLGCRPSKLVMLLTSPGPGEEVPEGDRFVCQNSYKKVVSNVFWSNRTGPWYGLCFMHRCSVEKVKDYVYILHDAPSQFDIGPTPDPQKLHKLFYPMWEEIGAVLYFDFFDHIQVTIVGFPEVVPVTTQWPLGGEHPEDGGIEAPGDHGIKDFIHGVLLSFEFLQYDRGGGDVTPEQVPELSSRIKVLSKEEYIATLSPGEWEIETQVDL